MTRPPEAPDPRTLVGSAIVFYLVMTLLGLGLIRWQDLDLGVVIFGTGEQVVRDTLIGAGSGLAVVLLTRLALRLEAVRKLNEDLGTMLGRPSSGAIAVLAVTSAVGEEILFRGGLQPLIGFWLTALVFGLVHGGTAHRYRAWVAFAFAAGLLLGGLMELTGNLLAPILCHLTVNYFNLHHVTRSAS
ncbi:MAG: CPBP family intramembrane glutamic endopeptidase [Myxococcota bacterium]